MLAIIVLKHLQNSRTSYYFLDLKDNLGGLVQRKQHSKVTRHQLVRGQHVSGLGMQDETLEAASRRLRNVRWRTQ